MMKKLILIAFFIISNVLVAQDDYEVPFAIVEQVPIYKGCDKNLSNAQLKKCMSNGITKHVIKNFNINVAKGLGLPDGKVRINVIFKVNKKGKIEDIRTRGPHPKLEEEAYRVVKLIPKLKPGYQKGKAVIVPYSLPLIFNIDNSKYRKKK